MYLYLFLNISSILFPLMFSFHPKLKFYKEWVWFFTTDFFVAGFFILWDILFTSAGVWGFNPNYVSGIYISKLPLEEILFFICIPYASLFTYHSLKIILPDFRLASSFRNKFTFTLILVTFVTGVIFHDKLYTCSSLLVASASLVAGYILLKEKLDHFYLMYAIILLPFLLINGILTGTGIPGEVVWYNNHENLGIRILTIPVEDVFYGMSLLLFTLIMMEQLKKFGKPNVKTP
ncbi:MAG: lycopene cyclase domain-containing protein [Saprospiraceae bacterium]